jgi:hypothetical protein
MAENSIWHKLGNIDYRIIYVVVMFLTAYPLWVPAGTPIGLGDNVKNYADQIEAMEPGTVIYISFSGYQTMLPDVEPIYMATWHMLFSKDVKLIIYLSDNDGIITLTNEFNNFVKPLENYGKFEGEDYVVLPYRAMGEAAVIAFTENVRSIFDIDWYGVDLETYPLWQSITDFNDVDWYIGGSPEFASRRYTQVYGVKLLCWGGGTYILPFVPPYYDPEAGPVYGYVGGSAQAGELETYIGRLGKGVQYNDAKNLGIVGLFLFILLGNIAYLGEKFGGGN